MREIIENQIRAFSNTPISKAEDFQVLDLGLSLKCWQRAVFRLDDGSVNRKFRLSVSIREKTLKLTMIQESAPHKSMEFSRTLTLQEIDTLPPKIKTILDEQGYFNICSSKDISINSSARPRNTSSTERMLLAVGYRSCALLSVRTNPNSANNLYSSLHGVGNNQPPYSEFASMRLPGACWFQGVFNAAENFSVEERSRLTFSTFPKAKQLLATAGRKKPQGDLIIYFGENTCLAEGVNGAGNQSMDLQNATSLRELDNYQSKINDGYVKATFNYPLIYATMMSAAKGFSTPSGVEYGVDTNNMPFVEFAYPAKGDYGEFKVKYTMRNSPATVAELPNNNLNILNLETHSVEVVRAPVQTGGVEATALDSPSAEPSELISGLGTEESILVNQWRDAYIAYNTARSLSTRSVDPLEHFNAFMMQQLEQGNEIEQAHFDLYNSLK
jgi:hypothetical protein